MNDWWSRKLGGGEPSPYLRPAPQPQPQYQQPYQTPRPQYAPAPPVGPTCPECGGPNYYTKGSAANRCFNCGYVEGRDFTNSTQGMISASGQGTATPAPQVKSAGYQPTVIVDRIG